MEFVREVPPLTELVAALEQATLMAKQLPSTTDPSHVLQVCSSLQNAHNQLGSFLAQFLSSQSQPQPQIGVNSIASTIREDEPMQVGDDDEVEAEEISMSIVDKVEEQIRDCFLQKKRRKRPLSPSSAVAAEAEQQQPSNENGLVQGSPVFDPQGTRLRSLDLILQFHC